MTPEEEIELQKFRDEHPIRLEKARKTALRFGILAIIALEAFVYAFFQQEAMEKHRIEHGMNLQIMTEKLRAIEEKAIAFEALATSEAVRARDISERCQRIKKRSK